MTKEQYENLIEWHNTWRDSLEIGEAFGRILFVIMDGMLNNPKNELHSYVEMIERTISAISLRRKIFGV